MISLIVLNVLNLFDLLMTWYFLSQGIAVEGNPIMATLGIGWKLLLVPAFSYMLYVFEAHKALFFLAVVYGAVALYHIYGLLTYA